MQQSADVGANNSSVEKAEKDVHTLADFVDNIETIDFSNKNILNATHNTTRVIVYEDLAKYKDIYELFDHLQPESGYLALLYQIDTNFGHWCALGLRGKTLEVFDPYGFGKLDAELDYTKYNNTPFLSQLVNNTEGLKVYIPKLRFQARKEHVNTCGRHVATRINFSHMDAETYFLFLVDKNPIGMRQRTTLKPGNFLDMTVAIMTVFY